MSKNKKKKKSGVIKKPPVTATAKQTVSATTATNTKQQDSKLTFDEHDIEQNHLLGIVAYLGVLFLVSLFVGKKSPYARFHANQGLILFIMEMLFIFFYYVVVIVCAGIGFMLPVPIYSLLGLVVFALVIMGVINGFRGLAKPLPFVRRFHIIKLKSRKDLKAEAKAAN